MVISTSNLVGIIYVGVYSCDILSRSVGQKTGSSNMADIQHIKCKKSTENVAKSPKFCTLTGNRGRRIKRLYLNLHRKFIHNRLCACAVQMLLKMAVNVTVCSTFKAQYGKSTSSRKTRTFRLPLTDHVISRMRRNSYVF